jgi:hypothetical protein
MSSILRVARRNPGYSIIRNETLQDETITWEARGVLAYLLSKPDDWTIRIQDLVNKSPSGRTVVKRILKELETAGYIHRERIHTEKGMFDWISTVYEIPTIGRFPIDGKPIDGEPIDISNTEFTNTEITENIQLPNEINNELASTTRRIRDINTHVKNGKAPFSPCAAVDTTTAYDNFPDWVHELKLTGYPNRKKLSELLKKRTELQVKSALEYYIEKHIDYVPHWSAALNAATKFFIKDGNTFDFNIQLARARTPLAVA